MVQNQVLKLWGWLTIVAALAFLSGCGTPVNVIETEKEPSGATHVAKKVVIADRSLADDIQVGELKRNRTKDGLLRAQQDLRNVAGRDITIEYKFVWFDQDGMHISSPLSSWDYKHFQPGETDYITGIAPTKAAEDFEIKLQRRE